MLWVIKKKNFFCQEKRRWEQVFHMNIGEKTGMIKNILKAIFHLKQFAEQGKGKSQREIFISKCWDSLWKFSLYKIS